MNTTRPGVRAALYARVSTIDQETENKLLELRRYAEARGWAVTEFVDRGVSGAKERRPALECPAHSCPPSSTRKAAAALRVPASVLHRARLSSRCRLVAERARCLGV
jgi:hypothetical protein